jgi:hypothetical protein
MADLRYNLPAPGAYRICQTAEAFKEIVPAAGKDQRMREEARSCSA